MLVALAILFAEPIIDKPKIIGPLRARPESNQSANQEPQPIAQNFTTPVIVPPMKESKPIPLAPVNTDAFDPLYMKKTTPVPIVPDEAKAEIENLLLEQALKENTENISSNNSVKLSFNTKIDAGIAKQMLDKNISDLEARMLGHWDSDLQTFFEPELKLPASEMHPRLHLKISSTKFGDNTNKALIAEYRKGGESGQILRHRIWTLSANPSDLTIILKAYEPKSNIKLSDDVNNYKISDFTYVNGCDIVFKRRGDNFSGDTLPGKCKLNLNNKIINVSEHHEIGVKNWDVSDIGVDNQGIRAFGNIDGAPTNLKKANMFTCWISYFDNKETRYATDLKLHDQGGVARYSFGNQNIGIRLRNIEWPYGNNRPSLTLYLLQNNSDIAPIYTWTNPDNNRIALSYNQYQASCTKD